MEKIKYFYRIEEDGYVFPKFSMQHFIIVLFLISICCFIIFFKESLIKDNKKRKILKLIFLFLLIFQQINFLYFFVFIKGTGIYESLPLYTCRFAIYASIFAIITGSEKFKGLSVYLGMIGSFIAFLSPDLEKYSFPHILFINYFLTHFLIYSVALYYIIIEKYSFSKEGLKNTLLILNLYLFITLFIDMLLDTNYAYLKKSPVMIEKFNMIPKMIYTLLIFLIYNLSIILCHKFLKFIKERKK